jgi:hypothetical protein
MSTTLKKAPTPAVVKTPAQVPPPMRKKEGAVPVADRMASEMTRHKKELDQINLELFPLLKNIISTQQQLNEHVIIDRWHIGVCLNEARRISGTPQASKRLAEIAGIPLASRHEMMLIAERIDQSELTQLTSLRTGEQKGLSWAHFLALYGLPDAKTRLTWAKKAIAGGWSHDQLNEELALAGVVKDKLGHGGGGRTHELPRSFPVAMIQLAKVAGQQSRLYQQKFAPDVIRRLFVETPPDKLDRDQLLSVRDSLFATQEEINAIAIELDRLLEDPAAGDPNKGRKGDRSDVEVGAFRGRKRRRVVVGP